MNICTHTHTNMQVQFSQMRFVFYSQSLIPGIACITKLPTPRNHALDARCVGDPAGIAVLLRYNVSSVDTI